MGIEVLARLAPVWRSAPRRLLSALVFASVAATGASADRDEEESKRSERSFVHFRYGPEVARTSTGGGSHAATATGGGVPADAGAHAHAAPSEVEIGAGQAKVRDYLRSRGGGALDVADTLKVYAAAGKGGFHSIHGLLGEGDIGPQTSRELGLGRKRFHEEVLGELTRAVKSKTRSLGVNDFGSGVDPAKINAKGDIDFTLYPKSYGVDAQWLVSEYNRLFTELARSRYGVDLSPGQMDIVAHRYDAMIPDWQRMDLLSDFELRLRTGTTLLKANPEAYFLEGAYLQQIMGRSTAHGRKTFTWLTDEGGQIKRIRVNAVQVPQFFYAPKYRKALGFGGAVGNYHFYHAHGDNFAARAKYILRSLDNGPGLHVVGKRGDYEKIESLEERRQIIEDIYDSPQLRYSKGLRDEIFEVYEICRKVRLAKDKPETLSEAEIYDGLVRYHKKIAGLENIDDAVALRRAQRTFDATSEVILTSNVLRTAKMRFRDWLRPGTVRQRVTYVDEAGNIVSIRPTKDHLTKLQFSAFQEIHDALGVLQRDGKQNVIDRLKQQNPRLKRDIEILEGILKKEREMMLATGDDPDVAMTQRQKAAQAVLDSWDELGRRGVDTDLWSRTLKDLGDAWATGQALESYLHSRMVDAVVFASGQRFGTYLEGLRASAAETNKSIIGPVWMARISRANSLVYVLTIYVEEGEFNAKVAKVAVVEGLSHLPLIGMAVDVQRAGGMAVGQIVLSQVVPGYGQVMLVVHTTKGVVNLGGTALFTPLKNQRIQLAYQGYLDPAELQETHPVYRAWRTMLLGDDKPTALEWWLGSTGRKDRIYSPRPPVLHPIDPEMKMSVEERRRAIHAYFRPRFVALFENRYGGGARIKEMPNTFSALESEFLRKVMYKHVHDWWEGNGVFAANDSLTVKRMMDEYYGAEMKQKLTDQLVSDYMHRKLELVQLDQLRQEVLQRLLAKAALRDQKAREAYEQNSGGIRAAHETAAALAMGQEQQEAEHIQPRIEITASPKVVMGEDESGNPTPVIERVNVHAKVSASDTEEHPGPFSVRWRVDSGARNEDVSEGNRFSFEMKPEEVPDQVTLTAIVFDRNDTPFHEHSVTIPIRQQEVSTDYDGGESPEEVLARLQEMAEEAEAMAAEAREQGGRARSALSQAGAAVEALRSSQHRLELELPTAERELAALPTLVRDSESQHADTEDAAASLERTVDEGKTLSDRICAQLETLQDEPNPAERTRILAAVEALRPGLRALLSKGRGQHDECGSAARRTGNAARKLRDLMSRVRTLADPAKAPLDEGPVLDQLIAADIAASAAEDRVRGIEAIRVDAAVEARRGLEFAEDMPTERRDGFERRIRALTARIDDAWELAGTSAGPVRDEVDRVSRSVEAMSGQLLSLAARRDKLRDVLDAHASDEKAAAQRSEEARFLTELAQDSLRQLQAAANDGAFCTAMAEDVAQPAALATILDVRGMPAPQAADLLRQRGFSVTTADAGTTSDPSRVHTVARQEPRGGGAATPGSTVTLLVYGELDVQGLLAQVDCSPWPNTVPAYEPATGRVQCRCGPGTIPDPNGSGCLDCSAHEAAFHQALAAGSLQYAAQILSASSGCGYAAQGAQLLQSRQQQLANMHCVEYETQIYAALNAGNINSALAVLERAQRDACQVSAQTLNDVRQVIHLAQQRANERQRREEIRRQQEAFNAFLAGVSQVLGGQQVDPNRRREPLPPPPSGPPPSTTAGGRTGMSQADCDKKFCPVCGNDDIDLLGQSSDDQCMDCRRRYKREIADCMRGGSSANRRDATVEQFRNHFVLECRIPVRNSTGRVVRYRSQYQVGGPGKPHPGNCIRKGSLGTETEIYFRVEEYNRSAQ